MKRKRYTEEQIISILKQHEAGRTMVDLAREYGMAENTLYRWKTLPQKKVRKIIYTTHSGTCIQRFI